MAAIDGRVTLLRERLHGLPLASQRERRDERAFHPIAAQAASLDARKRGLTPPDRAEWIAQPRGGHPA